MISNQQLSSRKVTPNLACERKDVAESQMLTADTHLACILAEEVAKERSIAFNNSLLIVICIVCNFFAPLSLCAQEKARISDAAFRACYYFDTPDALTFAMFYVQLSSFDGSSLSGTSRNGQRGAHVYATWHAKVMLTSAPTQHLPAWRPWGLRRSFN